jgi:hypothetical protein
MTSAGEDLLELQGLAVSPAAEAVEQQTVPHGCFCPAFAELAASSALL